MEGEGKKKDLRSSFSAVLEKKGFENTTLKNLKLIDTEGENIT